MSCAGASTFRPMRGSPRTKTPSATSPMSSPPTDRSSELRVEVDGEVETQNTEGVVRGTVERFPPSLFLRDTAMTQADAAIREFAARHPRRKPAATRLPTSCACWTACTRTWRSTPTMTNTAAEVRPRPLRSNAARASDLTHIFIGAAHRLGIPARYVARLSSARRWRRCAGEPATPGRKPMSPISAGSASIRPTAFARPTRHVRVAVGLDSLGAAPVRGTRYGAGAETLAVAIKVDQ